MNKIITIGREFGSGGREFGRRLALELGYEYYDKEIITEISNRTKISQEYVQDIVEQRPHQLFPITVGHSISYTDPYAYKQVQDVYQAQYEIIQELAKKSNCVIVGRCADYILKDLNPYRIFVYAQTESKVKRCIERNSDKSNLTEKEIVKYMKEIDKNRRKYYEYYTSLKWGDKNNYDLMVNTTNQVIKEIVPVIAKIFK